MNRFQPGGWHTITPRIITPTPREMVDFVKHVFDGRGDFHRSRPSEIRVGDSLIMIGDGDGLRPAMQTEAAGRFQSTGPAIFLRKPYAAQHLAELVKAALNGTR